MPDHALAAYGSLSLLVRITNLGYTKTHDLVGPCFGRVHLTEVFHFPFR